MALSNDAVEHAGRGVNDSIHLNKQVAFLHCLVRISQVPFLDEARFHFRNLQMCDVLVESRHFKANFVVVVSSANDDREFIEEAALTRVETEVGPWGRTCSSRLCTSRSDIMGFWWESIRRFNASTRKAFCGWH